MQTRKARFPDVEEIYALINEYAAKRIMLPKSRVALYETLRDFFVVEPAGPGTTTGETGRRGGNIIGCAALHLSWGDTAEIRSVAVRSDGKGRGIGSQLVEACLTEARELGLGKVFLFTYEPGFFARFGFQVTDKSTLPQKVWSDCLNCPYYPDCNETAMTLALSGSAGGKSGGEEATAAAAAGRSPSALLPRKPG